MSPIQEVARLIVPDDKNAAVSDERRELMLLASREVAHIWKYLQAKTVLERDIRFLVLVEEQLDDSGVHGHSDTNVEQLDTLEEAEWLVDHVGRTACVESSGLFEYYTLVRSTGCPESLRLLLVEPVDHDIALDLVEIAHLRSPEIFDRID